MWDGKTDWKRLRRKLFCSKTGVISRTADPLTQSTGAQLADLMFFKKKKKSTSYLRRLLQVCCSFACFSCISPHFVCARNLALYWLCSFCSLFSWESVWWVLFRFILTYWLIFVFLLSPFHIATFFVTQLKTMALFRELQQILGVIIYDSWLSLNISKVSCRLISSSSCLLTGPHVLSCSGINEHDDDGTFFKMKKKMNVR